MAQYSTRRLESHSTHCAVVAFRQGSSKELNNFWLIHSVAAFREICLNRPRFPIKRIWSFSFWMTVEQTSSFWDTLHTTKELFMPFSDVKAVDCQLYIVYTEYCRESKRWKCRDISIVSTFDFAPYSGSASASISASCLPRTIVDG